MIVVDVLEDFINGLNYQLDIVLVEYNITTDITTVTVRDTLYARERLIVLVNDIETMIVSVDYTDNKIEFQGEIVVTKIVLQTPFYIHGTPYAVNKQLDREVQYPFVYLLEILRETIPSELDSKFETIPTLRLFFLDEANFQDWDTDELYSNVVVPQRRYCDFFLKEIRKAFNKFGLPTNIEITSFAKFGEYVSEKGILNSYFNKTLSGVELRLDLPISKQKCS